MGRRELSDCATCGAGIAIVGGQESVCKREGGAHKELYPLRRRRGCKRDEGFLVIYVWIQKLQNIQCAQDCVTKPNLVETEIYMDPPSFCSHTYNTHIYSDSLIYDWQKLFFRFKGAWREIFDFKFFSWFNSHGPLSIPLGPLQICMKICGDINNFVFIPAIKDTDNSPVKMTLGINNRRCRCYRGINYCRCRWHQLLRLVPDSYRLHDTGD